MKEKRWLYFALGVSAVLGVGAGTNWVASVDPPGLTLGDQGIIFPDGSVQTTAATLGAGAVPCYCDGWATEGTKVVISCWRADNDAGFSTVPAGQYLLISDVTMSLAEVGDFWAALGKEIPGSVGLSRPTIEVTGPGFPDQIHRSFNAPHVVLAAGESLALRNLASSTGEVYIKASGFLVPDVAHHL